MELHTSKPKRSMNEIMNDPYRCANCGWQGTRGERVWVYRLGLGNSGYVCPECHKQTTERVEPPPDTT